MLVNELIVPAINRLYPINIQMSSPRLCFFIVIPLDLSVDHEDSLTS